MKAKMLELVLRATLRERATPAVAVHLESDLMSTPTGVAKGAHLARCCIRRARVTTPATYTVLN